MKVATGAEDLPRKFTAGGLCYKQRHLYYQYHAGDLEAIYEFSVINSLNLHMFWVQGSQTCHQALGTRISTSALCCLPMWELTCGVYVCICVAYTIACFFPSLFVLAGRGNVLTSGCLSTQVENAVFLDKCKHPLLWGDFSLPGEKH